MNPATGVVHVGGIIAVEENDVYGPDWDIGAWAYDPATGERLWTSRFGNAVDDDEATEQMVVAPDGSTVYLGAHVSGAARNYYNMGDQVVLALDASTGDRRWVARHGGIPGTPAGPSYTYPAAMAVTPDGTRVLSVANSGTGGARYGVYRSLPFWTFTTMAYDA